VKITKYRNKDIHVTKVVVIVVIVACGKVLSVETNAEPEYVLQVYAKTYRNVYPASFVTTLSSKSSTRKYCELDSES
jgi:hypothetical protein